jgi:hypothetical protein
LQALSVATIGWNKAKAKRWVRAKKQVRVTKQVRAKVLNESASSTVKVKRKLITRQPKELLRTSSRVTV